MSNYPETLTAHCFIPSADLWVRFGDAVLAIESEAFQRDDLYPDGTLQNFFETAGNTIVLLLLNNQLIGYSVARPVGQIWPERQAETDTVNISFTVIKPEHQNNGYVGKIMQTMEKALRGAGVQYMERNVAVANGYNEKILDHYGNRIIQIGPVKGSEYGLQQFFRIKL